MYVLSVKYYSTEDKIKEICTTCVEIQGILIELKGLVIDSRADCFACDDCVIRCESNSSDYKSLCVGS